MVVPAKAAGRNDRSGSSFGANHPKGEHPAWQGFRQRAPPSVKPALFFFVEEDTDAVRKVEDRFALTLEFNFDDGITRNGLTRFVPGLPQLDQAFLQLDCFLGINRSDEMPFTGSAATIAVVAQGLYSLEAVSNIDHTARLEHAHDSNQARRIGQADPFR